MAVTGGIGAGKSTFCRLMARKPGVVHLDADAVVHRMLREDQEVKRDVAARFGTGVLRPDGSIDREQLGTLAFGDRERLAALEALLHPRVLAELGRLVDALKRAGAAAIVLIEIPLLAESGVPPWCDGVATVEAPREIRIARLKAKGLSVEAITRRLARQASASRRRAVAGLVIENGGGRGDLERTVEELWRTWQADGPPGRTRE
jgi:dephospho-CoA kinase